MVHIKKIGYSFASIMLGVVVLTIPYAEGVYAAQNDGINQFVSILLGVVTLNLAYLMSYLFRKSIDSN